jgi:hypothetical protein
MDFLSEGVADEGGGGGVARNDGGCHAEAAEGEDGGAGGGLDGVGEGEGACIGFADGGVNGGYACGAVLRGVARVSRGGRIGEGLVNKVGDVDAFG